MVPDDAAAPDGATPARVAKGPQGPSWLDGALGVARRFWWVPGLLALSLIAAPFWPKVPGYLSDRHYGDAASASGVLLSLFGFVLTVALIRQSKGAADAAKDAANSTRATLDKYDALTECNKCVASIDNIKRLHQTGRNSYFLLPDRYDALRAELIKARTLTEGVVRGVDSKTFQEALAALAKSRTSLVDFMLYETGKPPTFSRLDGILTEQGDKLQVILAQLRAPSDGEKS